MLPTPNLSIYIRPEFHEMVYSKSFSRINWTTEKHMSTSPTTLWGYVDQRSFCRNVSTNPSLWTRWHFILHNHKTRLILRFCQGPEKPLKPVLLLVSLACLLVSQGRPAASPMAYKVKGLFKVISRIFGKWILLSHVNYFWTLTTYGEQGRTDRRMFSCTSCMFSACFVASFLQWWRSTRWRSVIRRTWSTSRTSAGIARRGMPLQAG